MRESHPGWTGKFELDLHYADLVFGDAKDDTYWKLMLGALPADIPAIVLWRNTWVGSPVVTEKNRRVMGYKEVQERLRVLRRQMEKAGTGLILFTEVIDDAPDEHILDIVDVIDSKAQSVHENAQAAELATQKLTTEGGIDLKAGSLNLETTGDNAEFNLPGNFNGVDLDNIEGLTPVIINVTPILDMPAFLGLTSSK